MKKGRREAKKAIFRHKFCCFYVRRRNKIHSWKNLFIQSISGRAEGEEKNKNRKRAKKAKFDVKKLFFFR